MKTTKNFALCVLAFTLISLNACNNPTTKDSNIDAEKAAIQIVINEHLDAADSLDVDRLLNCLSEDHVDMPPNMPKIIGKKAYGEYFSTWIDFFKNLKQNEMSFVPDEFIVSGDWAFQIGTYKTKFTMQNDYIIEDEGNYVWIFKKELNGNWKWARVISNSTKQLPNTE